jgi:hypothetical protein
MGTKRVRRATAAVVVAGGLLAFASAKPAEAISFTVYTDYGAWETAVQMYWTVLTEDFESPPATLNAGSFNGGTVATAAGQDVNIGDSAQGSGTNVWYDFADANASGTTSGQTTWTFDNPIRAWGAFWDLSPGGEGFGLNLLVRAGSGPPVPVQDLTHGTGPNIGQGTTDWAFYGFIANGDFNQVLVQHDSDTPKVEGDSFGEHYYMDNMVYAPEPGILTLLGMGLASAAFWMRRRRD